MLDPDWRHVTGEVTGPSDKFVTIFNRYPSQLPDVFGVDFQATYDNRRVKYEDERNSNGGKVKAKTLGAKQTVTAVSSSKVESRKFLGVFWPTAYFKDNTVLSLCHPSVGICRMSRWSAILLVIPGPRIDVGSQGFPAPVPH